MGRPLEGRAVDSAGRVIETSAKPPLMIRAFQWDLARQVERLDMLLKLLPRYADWGYQELYLHLEDAIVYPNFPDIARRDAYSTHDFARLVETAARYGIRTVPIVNLLGHTQYLIKVPALRDLNELRADDASPLPHGQICPLHPDTLAVADGLLRDVAPFCTAGKVHVGLDESFHLGRCPRCRAEIAERGLAAHFAGHVDRLHTLASSHGLRLGMWADMLNFIPSAIPRLPADIIAYDWYYYPFTRHPRVELYNFAESDLATPLARRGIEYWGCPMNGAFRFEPLPLFRDRLANIRSWWKRCAATRAGGFLVTSWEAYRLALEATTVVDAAAASLWLDPQGPHDDESLLTAGFARVFGRAGARTATRAALAADARAFAGYARWEINDRWDIRAGIPRPAPPKPRSSKSNTQLPAPLADSLAFLDYLDARDRFVAEAAESVFTFRRQLHAGNTTGFRRSLHETATAVRQFSHELKKGLGAARRMWRRSRDPREKGQNERILLSDTERLRAWRTWLQRVAKSPEIVFNTTPVCGRWQLVFSVVNVAPAVQQIVIEQQQPDGTWRTLRARHTIEFQSAAARPRTAIARPFSTPIDDPSRPLRLVVRGVGEVVIRAPQLTNGLEVQHALGWKRGQNKRLGRPAPRRGFPNVTRELARVTLRFSR